MVIMDEALALEFERPHGNRRFDETDMSLRAYISRIPPDNLVLYDSNWSDEQVMEWDGNFRDDGDLMLICCERDVDVAEFRRVVEEFIEFCRQRETD